MRRSKIKDDEVSGRYYHLGAPSEKMVLRARGIMHSSEHGKPSEDEEGTWSVKTGEVSFFSGIEVPKPLRFQFGSDRICALFC